MLQTQIGEVEQCSELSKREQAYTTRSPVYNTCFHYSNRTFLWERESPYNSEQSRGAGTGPERLNFGSQAIYMHHTHACLVAALLQP